MVMDYCYIGSTWIGFDDLKTIAKKVTYVKEKGLRGYYGWSVSADDNWALALKASETWDSTHLPSKNVGPTSMQPSEKNINLSISLYFIIIQIVFAFWGNHL
ncbi:hypothetical protein MRB53_013686 [Persea americana]|uniref:Uncharacterized protein n=1 Tax=Persea americana TaxID=3435 RepID=A0ACC2K8P1_PERAE|nr:hypothetical protein MRB53_013686 [Persea americana]